MTGIPMEFQFGTNWSHFSRFAGGVIGQTLAMEDLNAMWHVWMLTRASALPFVRPLGCKTVKKQEFSRTPIKVLAM